jgi:hypothetical protein
MKLLIENFRKFLEEASEPKLSASALVALKTGQLVNLKKFGGLKNFLKRTKISIIDSRRRIRIGITIDGSIAAMVQYEAMGVDFNMPCQADPFGDMTTYQLTKIARGADFKGYGLGRLLGFLSASYVTGIRESRGAITSDRNTSDLAGANLVKNLEMPLLGVKKSESFDYVGWLKRVLKDEMNKHSMIAQRGGGEEDKEYLAALGSAWEKVIPLTPDNEKDDCNPSVNVAFVKALSAGMSGASGNKEFFKELLKDIEGKSTKQLQDELDDDERVMGYSLVIGSKAIGIADNIIKALSHDWSSDELDDLKFDMEELFWKTYGAEVGEGGKSLQSGEESKPRGKPSKK